MSVETEQIEPSPEAVVETEQVVEQAAPNDDAAFLAGFNGVTTGEEEAQPEPEPEPEAEPEPVRIAGYTEDELKALFAKVGEVDRLKEREAKIWGTIGSMKQAQESRGSSKITKESFKRTAAEFPEMAEMLADDLSQLSIPSGGFDSSAVERIIEERLEKERKTSEVKLLSVMHPDWQRVVQEPEFQTWKSTLPPEKQDVLDNGWDALSIGEGLSTFKEWKSKTTQTAESKRKRLEQAIAPKTASRVAPVQTAEDAFMNGFKSVRGVK